MEKSINEFEIILRFSEVQKKKDPEKNVEHKLADITQEEMIKTERANIMYI